MLDHRVPPSPFSFAKPFLALPLLLLACAEQTTPTGAPPEVAVADMLRLSADTTLRLQTGASLQLRARKRDALSGRDIPIDAPLVWSASDPDIAAVDVSGLVVARSSGYSLIRVQLDTLRDSVWVHVPSTERPPLFFAFEFDHEVSAVQRQAAMRAAARWSAILPQALASESLRVSASECNGALRWDRSTSGEEDGVRILVSIASLPQAAGTAICKRRTDGKPLVVLIAINPGAPFDQLTLDTWGRVWFHELGHALGLASDPYAAPGTVLVTSHMLAGYLHDYGRTSPGIMFDRYAHWVGVPGDIMDNQTGTSAEIVGRTTVGRLRDLGYPAVLTQSGPLDLQHYQ